MAAAAPRFLTLPHASDPARIARCGKNGDIVACGIGVAYARSSHLSRIGNLEPTCILPRMESPQDSKLVPTVSRVSEDTIVELVYDSRKRTTALVICRDGQILFTQRLKIETGETLVPYAADNNLIRHRCVLLPSRPVESGGKAQLIADIKAFLHRYVDLTEDFESLAAHYALLTWVYDAFSEVPYLRFKGDFGSGKTRALIALGSIVYKGFFASAASTVSPIFHTLDRFGGTLILDEADLRFSDKTADLVKILNNGTVKGLPVLRTLQNAHKEFNPAAFTVYGPKIVAMRGTFRDAALESRFITEEMGTRPLRDAIPIQLPKTLRSEALLLRNRLLHFRLTNLFAIKTDPSRVVDGIDPRLNQMALSLLSLVDDPALRASFETSLRQRNLQLAAQRGPSIEDRTLTALSGLCETDARTYIPLQEITDRVNRDGSPGWISAREIGRVLRDRSLPVYKSHGRVAVPKSAVAPRAIPRNPSLADPETAPLEIENAAPGENTPL